MRLKSLAAILAAFVLAPSVHGAAPGLAGHWEGAIELPGQKLGINLDFQPEGDG